MAQTRSTWDTVETTKSPKGVATIKIGERKVKVIFQDGTIDRDYSKDELPEYPDFIHKLPKGQSLEAFVVLSKDKQTIDRIGPERGHYVVSCVDFVRPEEGAQPVAKEYTGQNKQGGGEYKYKAFTAILEIVEGKWAGATIPTFFHYKFDDNGRGKAAFIGNESKSPNLRKLKVFCDVTGVTRVQFDWPEDGNILPQMLKQIKKVEAQFAAIMLGGYVDTLTVGDEDDNYPDDPPAPKAKGKKVAPAKGKAEAKSSSKAKKYAKDNDDEEFD